MKCRNRISVNRREMMRTAFAASLGAFLPTLIGGTRHLRAAEARLRSYDFEPVREHIHQALVRGKATGATLAVAHDGQIIWEEGFGWANREVRLRATAHTPFSL